MDILHTGAEAIMKHIGDCKEIIELFDPHLASGPSRKTAIVML